MPDSLPPQTTHRTGTALLVTGLLVFLSFTGLLFHYGLYHRPEPEIISHPQGVSITLHRQADSQFRIPVIINGVTATLLVDTGATHVAIPGPLIQATGLPSLAAVRTQTAGGIVPGYMSRIDSLHIGSVELKQVSAILLPSLNSQEGLLGMNVLQHFQLQQSADTLVLHIPRQGQL